jgi:hypothetical protein
MDRKPLTILVECHAGYRSEEEPRAFTLGERRFAVDESGEWELATLLHAGTAGA